MFLVSLDWIECSRYRVKETHPFKKPIRKNKSQLVLYNFDRDRGGKFIHYFPLFVQQMFPEGLVFRIKRQALEIQR